MMGPVMLVRPLRALRDKALLGRFEALKNLSKAIDGLIIRPFED